MFDSLFRPETVAVIGASRHPGKVGHALVANLVAGGYGGRVVPVTPKGGEICGLETVPRLSGAVRDVDLAIVAVAPDLVEGAVTDAAMAGARTVVVITAGFKEVGPEGAAREARLVELCRRHRIRLMGPNCVGLLNTHHAMNASFAPAMPGPGGISMISQSGALCVAILDWAKSRGIGMAKVVSFGNKADLDEADLLRALAADPETDVIAGYLESIEDGDDFLAAAEEAASVKPVVILKVGVTRAGARAASSHTGSLAGTDMAYGAAFRRAGVVRADSLDALFDLALAFSSQPVPSGRRLAVLTNAGGPGIMAADAAEAHGLELAPPSESLRAALADLLPAAASTANPIDVLGDADPERFGAAFELVQAAPDADAVLVLATPQNMTRPADLVERLVSARDGSKPVVAAFLGGDTMAEARRRLVANRFPEYSSPERAVAALSALAEYGMWRRRPPRVVTRFAVNRRRVERVLRWHRRMGLDQVGEMEAKAILRAYDFNVLPGDLAESADGAVRIADRIGYPVVLKVSSPDIVHKSDVGGVRLHLSSSDQVRDAYDLLMLRIERRRPDARIRGAYVEKMGRRGREVIVGMTRDRQFGPMLMFGLGGIFVEVMKDVTFHLAPITADEAMQMLRGTRSFALLEGARGSSPVDLEAIAGALQRISQLATERREIAELDINPFIVGAVGEEAYVADARMTLARERVKDVP